VSPPRVAKHYPKSLGEFQAWFPTDADLAQGRVYPPLANIRGVSAVIAVEVARIAYERGLARREQPEDLMQDITAHMYQPEYRSYV